MDFPRQLVEATFISLVPKAKKIRRANGRLLINASCPICNEGKSKRKKRFYLYEKGQHYNVECKNCFYSRSFTNFLKDYHADVYENLKRQCLTMLKEGDFFTRQKDSQPIVKISPNERIDKYLRFYFSKCCFKLNEPQTHPKKEKIREYAISKMKARNLAESVWSEYFFCFKGNFQWRVIIPFTNAEGRYYNFQARDIKPEPKNLETLTQEEKDAYEDRKAKKYIFAQFDKIDLPDDKLYKQYHVDPSQTVYICEGILDSEFIDNSIATCGVGIGGDKLEFIKENYPDRIFCLDSPWSDKAGWEIMCKLLESGEKCFMMPIEHKDCKDMNDLAKKLNVEKLPKDIINNNVLVGKAGLIKLKVLTTGLYEQQNKRYTKVSTNRSQSESFQRFMEKVRSISGSET